MLGYSSVTVTLGTDGHVRPALKRDAGDRMDVIPGLYTGCHTPVGRRPLRIARGVVSCRATSRARWDSNPRPED